MEGRIIKGVGGFYYVSDGNTILMGNARRNLRRNKEVLYVGDLVTYEIRKEDGDCIITGVRERKNVLSRPPVSNLDLLVVTFAAAHPDPNLVIIDKLTAVALSKGIDVAVAITKRDLVEEERLRELQAIYQDIFPVVALNGMTGEGITELKKVIAGKNVAFAGPSGAGKSTLITRLTGREDIEVGEISDKTKRGRHTTRHVEIFSLPDGTSVYDTPGFTSLELDEKDPLVVRELFPEMKKLQAECRYGDCMHLREPECAVREAVEEGTIADSRFRSYQLILEETRKWHR